MNVVRHQNPAHERGIAEQRLLLKTRCRAACRIEFDKDSLPIFRRRGHVVDLAGQRCTPFPQRLVPWPLDQFHDI
ncbi:MAG TPA: hypothetical protein VGQ93_00995 [Lysobacter sp.]|jgi:hypothetical protein|nr:hypothetical protein [Lysobacter sp.]